MRLEDRPDDVVVHEVIGESSSVYEIKTGDGDLGKIIGKQGQTSRSIRTILAGVGAKESKRVVMEPAIETRGGGAISRCRTAW